MGRNGHEKLILKNRQWDCPMCGVHHIRDYNAALNILEKGLPSFPIRNTRYSVSD
ncbi:zinc ribbon domain-containing protein [Lactobacillus sp.]|uniref:zinc ribbon domain-containing protein n=1 Tax=Lactobacillus sp. TaxID=1591 RepID=UPI003EF7B4C2